MNDDTIERTRAFFARFGPYICLVAAIAAVAIFLPGGDESSDVAAGSGGGDQFGDFQSGDTSDDGTGFDSGTGGNSLTTQPGGGTVTNGGGATPGATVPRSGGGGGGQQAAPSGGGGVVAPASGGGQAAPPAPPPGSPVANCDPATGRIAIPSLRAPACVDAYRGDNGGATYQGVSGDTIKLGIYLAQGDASSEAILSAAGANDSDEVVEQQIRELAEFYTAHYEQYGRTVELIFVQGSGPATDDAVGRADAKAMISKGVIASIYAPNNVYVDELVANGVMCFCTVSQPNTFYTDRAPFVWSGSLMSSSQGYFHRAEFIRKRINGRNAEFAGDPLFQTQKRVFGLAYYDDDQKSYRPGIDFFLSEMDKAGIPMAAIVAYKGYPDTAASQEAARPLIQKMKSAGVTSLIFSGDPFAPIFFTQEATRQQYQPEWIITGSALTDTSLFARLYDQTQWSNAFGVSFLAARVPEEKGDLYHKLVWHFGHEPPASTYGVINAPFEIFWEGVHYAGPNLNPGTFRDGMFNAPANGGGISLPQASYGPAGKIWPFDDYTTYDDITLIWWDPTATGEDEVGNNAAGLYRYVDMGKRYLPGQQPDANTKAFQVENTVTIYEDYPPGDKPPDYPPPAR